MGRGYSSCGFRTLPDPHPVCIILAGLICIPYNKTTNCKTKQKSIIVKNDAILSSVNHSSELQNLKGFVRILWICSQLIKSTGEWNHICYRCLKQGAVLVGTMSLNLWGPLMSLGAQCQKGVAVYQMMSEQLGMKWNRFESEPIHHRTQEEVWGQQSRGQVDMVTEKRIEILEGFGFPQDMQLETRGVQDNFLSLQRRRIPS